MWSLSGHPGVEYAAFGVFLMTDVILWRDVLRVPPTQRHGQVTVAVVYLVPVMLMLLDLLESQASEESLVLASHLDRAGVGQTDQY
jgi:hypothetical protein